MVKSAQARATVRSGRGAAARSKRGDRLQRVVSGNSHYSLPAIHSNKHGFIRAEVISYDDFTACKGEADAKEKGKMRLEGKDYVVRDGDVMHFRFNV